MVDSDPEKMQEIDKASPSESNDSDTSDESSSDEEVDMKEEDMELMMKLEADLEANPSLYDTHIQYIDLLRRCRVHARLRSARESMASCFPLSEQLWMDWLQDETEQGRKHGSMQAEDLIRIAALYDKATQDYLSTNIWCSYIEHLMSHDADVAAGTAEGAKRMRSVCESALTAAGLHVSEGGRLWTLYRGYEQKLAEQGAGDAKQEERVRSLFSRQLAVPLADGGATLAAYTAWEAAHGREVPSHVAKAAGKAAEAAALRRTYEAAVAADKPPDAALLAGHMAYIKLEAASGEPARVGLAYERAIAKFPVTHELWLQYARYLETHLKIASVVSDVYERALRNCPWVGALWARAIRAAARDRGSASAALDAQMSLYERAMKAGLPDYEAYMEVILARLDGARHAASCDTSLLPRMREAFAAVAEQLAAYFPGHVDCRVRLPAYAAHCEVVVARDVGAARKVWEDALKAGYGKRYEAWAAYAAFERALRNVREARGVYKRGYGRRLEDGGHVALCADWLNFEREEGSPDDHLAASLKVEPVLEEAAAAATAAADAGAAAVAKAAAQSAPKLSKEEMLAMRREQDPNFGKKHKAAKGTASRRRRSAAH